MKKKNLLIFMGIIFVIVLLGCILIVHDFILGYTPIFKERGNFNANEIRVIEDELGFEFSDESEIVNSWLVHARDSDLFFKIDGITDKEAFCKKMHWILEEIAYLTSAVFVRNRM